MRAQQAGKVECAVTGASQASTNYRVLFRYPGTCTALHKRPTLGPELIYSDRSGQPLQNSAASLPDNQEAKCKPLHHSALEKLRDQWEHPELPVRLWLWDFVVVTLLLPRCSGHGFGVHMSILPFVSWITLTSASNAQDLGSISGSERLPGEGNSYPLQYTCLENSMDRGAWRAAVHRVTKSQTGPILNFGRLGWSTWQNTIMKKFTPWSYHDDYWNNQGNSCRRVMQTRV